MLLKAVQRCHGAVHNVCVLIAVLSHHHPITAPALQGESAHLLGDTTAAVSETNMPASALYDGHCF
jgi:hypothetical protein